MQKQPCYTGWRIKARCRERILYRDIYVAGLRFERGWQGDINVAIHKRNPMIGQSMISIPDKTKLVTVAEMQAIERAADARGHSYAEMMEIAGGAVAATITERFG